MTICVSSSKYMLLVLANSFGTQMDSDVRFAKFMLSFPLYCQLMQPIGCWSSYKSVESEPILCHKRQIVFPKDSICHFGCMTWFFILSQNEYVIITVGEWVKFSIKQFLYVYCSWGQDTGTGGGGIAQWIVFLLRTLNPRVQFSAFTKIIQ